ncbi:branched-chain amino acid transport system II carrier protein [Fusobacterium nucleatum]|uniref:Branched-chain amino acid transport system II carrier protein n=1 Tax=Fusobacterium nucleatum subsp. nucleatum (strain ATCC 25586 / DSM 15643 / BCRC 10681 / CIP 101130 / JCM 8532 / KCTC 2640 / LMG 13131 / VPI 4355) TaxID=190304 RepID=Q8REN9_FUSNN|nr:branched-chain amino acid transport system II carrier protein [Fusobacterium nucleatum]AAL95255.1 Branched chain amino acid transport system II carrier protein [Fusobacterium nucleatum subsp. nucleatum ATCC 25586]AVQ15413.1 branched-chain amino acid transport system II carrier protein [Fusobacterium nucleatum subsp. nucleatum ATCC 25586]WMS30337.1 branched-chain amino acid transport system II carrier protein [Fusobacterium nucleatum]
MYKTKDVLLTGFALFAMLFGAGNLIFPPMLGYETSSSWTLTMLAFIITGVGFPFLGILSVSIAGNGIKDFANRVSPTFSKIFAIISILAIGPMLAIPRTGATAYEITFLYNRMESPIYKYIYLICYFGIVILFSLRANKVIERVGKILTPILLILLFLIIIKGIFFANLSVKPDVYPHAFKKGFLEGYQTMDTIASIAYAGIILKAIKNGRNLTQKQEFSFLIKAGLVAILSLALIYGGFALVGAKMHSVLATNDKIELLVKTTSYLLGNYGNLVLAICVAGACLTTAIGLIATVGEFFSSITSFKYEKIVAFTVIISFLLSILGVESIIRISVPILVFIYPIIISLIVLNLFGKYIKNDYVYKGVVLFTGIIGLIESLDSLGIKNYYTDSVLEILPFSDYGLTWLFPGLVGYILFSFMFRKVKK